MLGDRRSFGMDLESAVESGVADKSRGVDSRAIRLERERPLAMSRATRLPTSLRSMGSHVFGIESRTVRLL